MTPTEGLTEGTTPAPARRNADASGTSAADGPGRGTAATPATGTRPTSTVEAPAASTADTLGGRTVDAAPADIADPTPPSTTDPTPPSTTDIQAGDAAEATDQLLSIGVFARRSRLSLKALRLYDRLGLLTPADVDPGNGYRRYRESQLFAARLIVLLRQLDMPLSTVRDILAAPGATGADVLTAYWEAIERRLAGQRELAALLRTSLLGGDARFDGYDVREREVPDQLVLTECRHLRLEELESWLTATKVRLSAVAQDNGGMTGPLFVIFHGAVNDDSDGPVEVCVPVRGTLGRDGALPADGPTAREEPAHREAYVRVTKAQFDMPQILSAYDAVERWMTARKRTCAGSPREVYLPGVDVAAAAPTDHVCDVAYPI
ncbi:MerR family transcriptional regulator [Actinopolymorpha sp. B9G3]|uniref:MerR family transcriptional regulator n=1 Tax=Actinopolymorpha sp. B9G3 TaxID=3158970 RepID=UPI0032D8BA3B